MSGTPCKSQGVSVRLELTERAAHVRGRYVCGIPGNSQGVTLNWNNRKSSSCEWDPWKISGSQHSETVWGTKRTALVDSLDSPCRESQWELMWDEQGHSSTALMNLHWNLQSILSGLRIHYMNYYLWVVFFWR